MQCALCALQDTSRPRGAVTSSSRLVPSASSAHRLHQGCAFKRLKESILEEVFLCKINGINAIGINAVIPKRNALFPAHPFSPSKAYLFIYGQLQTLCLAVVLLPVLRRIIKSSSTY